MSQPGDGPQDASPGGPAPPQDEITPEQEEMLRRMEEEMRNVRVQDVVLQSVVSILNLSARRIAKEDERDLAQGKLGIDAVSALVDLLPEDQAREIKNALSQVQMLYAQQARGGEGPAPGGEPGSAGGGGGGEPSGGRGGPPGGPGAGGEGGGRKPSGGLWTPPGVS